MRVGSFVAAANNDAPGINDFRSYAPPEPPAPDDDDEEDVVACGGRTERPSSSRAAGDGAVRRLSIFLIMIS